MTSRLHNKHVSLHSFTALVPVLGCMLSLAACQGSGTAHGAVEAIDMRSETLLGSDLQSLNGTYGAGCTDRTGAWSIEIELGANLDNEELSVVLNDSDCVLTVTELRTDVGLIAAVPPISLGTSYKAMPSEFEDPVEFYGNAKLNSLAYSSDFVLTFLYSDDPALATDDNTASFEVVESSVTGDSVAAPNFVIDPDDLMLLTDTNQIVQSATGGITFVSGTIGQTYVVVDAVGLDTYAELDAAYLGGTPAAIGASAPAADFTLVGEDLDAAPVQRTLILANIEDGVASYQSFEITFQPAPAL